MTVPCHQLVSLDLQQPIWTRFFSVAPLVVVGTREPDGSYDLAPKHRAMPLGDNNYFGFVCTPRHHTYQNILREQVFTVSFLHPHQVLAASLSATPRNDQDQKPALQALPTVAATVVEGRLLAEAALCLECRLFKMIDGFGDNSLITGEIVAAQVDERALRVSDVDDQDVLLQSPLLAYLSPGRYAQIDHSYSFPFHVGFHP
jgi:flavin reductase (DIM6/NTAB) family NADH-FMN oxidoreductase RutF